MHDEAGRRPPATSRQAGGRPRAHPAGEVHGVEPPRAQRLGHGCRATPGAAHHDDAAVARQLVLALPTWPIGISTRRGRMLGLPLVGFPHVEQQRARVRAAPAPHGPDRRGRRRAIVRRARCEVGSPAPSQAAIAAEQIGHVGEAARSRARSPRPASGSRWRSTRRPAADRSRAASDSVSAARGISRAPGERARRRLARDRGRRPAGGRARGRGARRAARS